MNAVADQAQLLPPRLQTAVQRARVLLFASPLTDARPVTGWLNRHGIAFEQVELSMASAQSRDEFHQLQAATGWRGLPQIFIDGQCVLDELGASHVAKVNVYEHYLELAFLQFVQSLTAVGHCLDREPGLCQEVDDSGSRVIRFRNE